MNAQDKNDLIDRLKNLFKEKMIWGWSADELARRTIDEIERTGLVIVPYSAVKPSTYVAPAESEMENTILICPNCNTDFPRDFKKDIEDEVCPNPSCRFNYHPNERE